MASVRCFDNSDVIATQIMTNFHLYLIQLWWQCFQIFCLWRRSLCSNLVGIDPEKLYLATFICQYGLCCCIVWPSFLFECFVKFGQLARVFWANGLPSPPPGRKLPVRLRDQLRTTVSEHRYKFCFNIRRVFCPPGLAKWKKIERLFAFNLLLSKNKGWLLLEISYLFQQRWCLNFGTLDHFQGRPILFIVQSYNYHSLEESVSFIKTVNKLKDTFFLP